MIKVNRNKKQIEENNKRMLAITTPKFDLESLDNLIVIKNNEDKEVMFIWGKISKTFLFINESFSKWEDYFRREFLGETNYHSI